MNPGGIKPIEVGMLASMRSMMGSSRPRSAWGDDAIRTLELRAARLEAMFLPGKPLSSDQRHGVERQLDAIRMALTLLREARAGRLTRGDTRDQ